MNEFEMLMGLGGSDQADYSALADQMRRRNQGAQMMMLSPTAQVSNLGKANYNQAYDTATRAGAQRNSALARSRQAERDRVNDQQWAAGNARSQAEHDRKMAQQYDMSQAEIRTGTDGVTRTFAPRWADGEIVEIPALQGNKPATSGYKGVTRSDDDPRNWKQMTSPTGEKYMQNMQTGEIRYADGSVSPEEMGEIKGTVKYGENYGGERGKASAEWVDNAVDSGYAAAQSKRALMQPLNDILQATREGARTGHLWNMLPDMTDVAGRFSAAVDALTLDNLTQYKLTPVSDKDIAVLKSAAVPIQSNEATAAWAEHKIQAFELLAKADEAVADYINEIGRRPNASDRAKMKQIVDGIVGDFDFTFKQATDKPKVPASSDFTAPAEGEDPAFDAWLKSQGNK